jgi:hypothetical protein
MRAGPLSNPKVIDLLNSHFVCVFTTNGASSGDKEVDRKESAERQRLFQEFTKAKLSTGEVSPYILTSDAHALNRLSIGPALEKDNLMQMLEKTVADLKLAKGKPVVKPMPQVVPPKVPPGSLILHLTARKLIEPGSWNEFPSEDFIILDKEEAGKLLPKDKAETGVAWEIDKKMTRHLLTHFFPQTETTTPREDLLLAEDGPHKHRIEQQQLKAKVISTQNGTVRIRLSGNVKLHHSFYPGREDKEAIVDASIVGYLDFDADSRKITALSMATDKAVYGKTPIGVAVRLVDQDRLTRTR